MSEEKITDNLSDALQRIAKSGQIAHAYLLEGNDAGALLSAARGFASSIGAGGADLILTEQEKPNLISVDDVRTGLVSSVAIRPYGSPYKVYIVRNAELMNPQAQNALLKTLEEPPSYVVILLLAANTEVFLPTILSRCVKLTAYAADADPAAESAEKQEALRLADDFFREGMQLDTGREVFYAGEFAKRKLYAGLILDRFLLWYRDILYCRMTGSTAGVVLAGEKTALRSLAEEMSDEGINRCIETVDRTRHRLDANVNTDISFEVLVMALRKGRRG